MKKIILLCLSLLTLQVYALNKPDFYNIVDRDTAYFAIRPDRKTVSLVDWRHVNGNNKIVIPKTAYYEGKTYRVTAIGSEVMGCQFYGDDEWDRAYTPFDENGLVVVPEGVTFIGYCAFTARLRTDFRVILPNSIEILESSAVNCLSIKNEKDEIILPANLIWATWLLDGEDHVIQDFEYSKLYIPEFTEYIGNLDGFHRNQPRFKKTEVHPKNKYYKTINGTLYSYELDKIYWSTVQEHLYLPKNLSISVFDIGRMQEDDWYPAVQCPSFESIEVEEGNPFNEAQDGYLYDKKNKTLIMGVRDSTRVANIPAWCRKIYVFDERQLPWSYKLDDNADAEDVASFLIDLTKYINENKRTTISYLGHTETFSYINICSVISFMEQVIKHNPKRKDLEKAMEHLENYYNR